MTGLTGNNAITGAGYKTNQPTYEIDQSLLVDNAGADNSANHVVRLQNFGSESDPNGWATDGNQKTWTISFWMKWDNEDSYNERFIYWVNGARATSDVMGYDVINLVGGQLQYYCYVNAFGSQRALTKTNRVLRDPGAWYHCVLAMDSTLAVNNDRLKLYINGVRETSFAQDSQIGQDQTTNTNMNADTYVGASISVTSTESFGGYLAEFHRIDGQALGPEYFGETNADTNQWVPIEVTGMTYGTNGFYLPFSSTELANSFTDSSSSSHTITANGDVSNTRAQKKIGSSSIYFDGSGDYLSTASSGMGLTGDYTIECWFNTASSTSDNGIISNKYNNSSFNGNFSLRLNDGGNSNDIAFRPYNGTVAEGGLVTSSTGAWSDNTWTHVAVVKSGSGTGNVKMYIDGSLAGTSSGESSSTILGNAGDLNIGRQESASAGTNYLNGYMDEIRISNTARYTSSFTPSTTAFTADANTLLLIHSDFNGGIGADSSGNTNDFTPHNLTANDVVADTPTNNFATLNPIYEDGSASSVNPIFAEGNLSITATDGNFHVAYSTITIPASGKWYLETYLEDGDIDGVGIVTASGRESVTNGWGMGAVTTAQGFATQANYVNNSSSNNFTLGTGTPSNGDICQLAIDADNNKVWIGLNNSWNDASGGTTGNPSSGTNHTIALTFGSDAQIGLQKTNASPNTGMVANFGQDSSFAGNKTAQGNTDGNGIGDFYYTPPTGFKALCSDNLPDPSIADPTKHFNTNLWTGNGSTGQSINVGFQPDFLWTKERAETTHHGLRNSVTGVTKTLSTSIISIAEQTETDGVTAFTSTGFNLSGDGYFYVNRTGKTMVGWSWKAGGTASSNTDGSITSSVSANTDAGFSIVSYTGTGSTATVGHGLSVAPELLIVKNRTDSGTAWQVGSDALTSWLYYITLSSTAAQNTNTQMWNSTAPTSSVFTVKDAGDVNTNTKNYIAYCFHSVDGYSKVGNYTGNASTDGPFVYTGFRPAWIILKNITTGGGGYSWVINDSKRVGYNADNKRLRADTLGIEDDTGRLDIFSNGFKLTQTYNEANQSGATFIYLAFAESPFKYSNAR